MEDKARHLLPAMQRMVNTQKLAEKEADDEAWKRIHASSDREFTYAIVVIVSVPLAVIGIILAVIALT